MDLDAFRRNGHAAVDWVADYLATLRDRPVWSPVAPGDVRRALPARAPRRPEPFADMLADLDEIVVPGLTHWQHPGWMAYFPANSSPPSVLGELVSAGLGVQGMLWSTSPAATEVESTVLDWLVDELGLPSSWRVDTGPGGGVIQMSASDATHTALVVARTRATIAGAAAEDCVVYASEQAHSSIEKGARVAGIGHVRLVSTDDAHAMDPVDLSAAVAADRADGLVPMFVCSAVGTTGTTAVDPVRRIGEIARDHGLWHHVDAAYAGTAMLCPELRHLQDGLELADSYVTNAHKWLFTNFDCSLFWVADRAPLVDTLSIVPPYLRNTASESGEVVDYRDWHVPLGRRFRALKLWWVLRSFGTDGLRARIREHLAWARGLTERLEADHRFTLVAPTPFALVSVRHADPRRNTVFLDTMTAHTDLGLTASELDGQRFLRISLGATWTQQEDVDRLWQALDEAA
ncbi:aminotransferase class I/II-fold pyridoxal phosphate-dependent enzyme [Nitriliruptoria bacterium AS10]|nr:aminotransferase class I/II-fold pyridoxal phosphate-dependent enzyme [Salsipaludibacter albus]